jgi:hypothetical protein
MSPILKGVVASQITGRLVTGSYEYINSATLVSDQAYIEITGIPSTYKHLRIHSILKDADPNASGGATRILCSFNGDSNNSHYYNGGEQSYGTAALTSFREATRNSFGYGTRNADTNIWGTNVAEIANYAQTGTTKVSMIWGAELSFTNTAGNALLSHHWVEGSTFPAINSIRFASESGYNLKAGSTFAIYGLKES